jgi:hypothetical protein
MYVFYAVTINNLSGIYVQFLHIPDKDGYKKQQYELIINISTFDLQRALIHESALKET